MTTIQAKAGFGELGFTLLAILYGTQTIAAMFGAGIVTKLSIKKTLVLAAFCMSMVSFA